MKLTLFLYNFAKIFIPGAILLCIIFSVTQRIPKVISLQKQPPPVVHKTESNPAPTKKAVVPKPAKPSYIYIVDFKSGGTMKAKEISIKNNIVTLWVEDGYSVKMAKNDIQKIKKQRM